MTAIATRSKRPPTDEYILSPPETANVSRYQSDCNITYPNSSDEKLIKSECGKEAIEDRGRPVSHLGEQYLTT